jgi:hypothetical protein
VLAALREDAVDQSHRDDDFEGFAPPRRIDRGAPQHSERPDWLTATGRPEGVEHADFDTPPVSRGGLTRPLSDPEPQAEPAPPPESEWENAVEHAAYDRGPGPQIRFHKQRSWLPDLSSIVATLSRSSPLVFVALAVIAVVALMMFRPREGEQTASIAAIHKHPERFDGRPVKVRGRVGEVYEVGGGYAFHLYQGREDIVVFTRSRVPVRREELTIEGSISNGILDGKPRQALFETPH